MKRLLLILCLLPVLLHAQKTPRNVTFDGVSRSYIEYVPTTYDGATSFPLIISLHGLGDTDDNFSNVGFELLSETENFIVVTPQALSSPLGTAWNSGAGALGITLNSTVKDVEFISFLIDSFSNHYNIDLNRVYATGFSMGGFMSNRLACELNDRIAAIGSVAGTIGSGITCTPGKAVPVIHFHGTSDGTVAYSGNTFGTDAEETVDFWAENANCDETPDSSNVPDAVADGITLTHYTYKNGDADIEFFKAEGAGHDWLYKPNNDIYYTVEIWNFLSRQSLGSDVTGLLSQNIPLEFNTYPNPLTQSGVLEINSKSTSELAINIYDLLGQLVYSDKQQITSGENRITFELNDVSNGSYLLSLKMDGKASSQIILVQ